MTLIFSALFACAGVGLLIINTANNLAEINRVAFAIDTSAVVIGLAAMSALFSLFFAQIWRMSRCWGFLIVVIMIGCMSTSMRLTADRIGDVAETGKQPGRNTNGRITRLDATIGSWEGKLETQRPMAALECRGYTEASNPRNWPKCLTARALISQYEARLEATYAERSRLGETLTVERHSERFIAWMFGTKAQRATSLFHPVIIAGLLELGTMAMFGIAGLFAVACREPGRANAATLELVPADPVVALLARRQQTLTNQEIAQCLGISPSAASQRVKLLTASGTVTRQRVGKHVAIRLA